MVFMSSAEGSSNSGDTSSIRTMSSRSSKGGQEGEAAVDALTVNVTGRGGHVTPERSPTSSLGHVSVIIPDGERGGEREGRARSHYGMRSHSYLWELWTGSGSEHHEVDFTNEQVLLQVPPMKRSASSTPSPDETIELLEGKNDRKSWLPWKRFSSAMKYASARRLVLCLWLLTGVAFTTYAVAATTVAAQNSWRHKLQMNCNMEAALVERYFSENALQVAVLRGFMETFYVNLPTPMLNQTLFEQQLRATKFARPLVSLIVYARKVTNSERISFEQNMQRPILSFNSGTLRAEAPQYAPIVFTESSTEQAQFGFPDILEEPSLRAATEQASFSALPALSAPLRWREGASLGLAMAVPFYPSSFNTSNSTAAEREAAVVGWLVGSLDSETLVKAAIVGDPNTAKGLKEWIYDTTNTSNVKLLYGAEYAEEGNESTTATLSMEGSVGTPLDLGDAVRRFELRCSQKKGEPFPWGALGWAVAVLVVTVLVAQIMRCAGNRIVTVEKAYRRMKRMRDETLDAKLAAEAADVSKSQFLATVSHEIRTPLNGVLGMLTLLRDTKLDATQIDYVQTAVLSGKALISLINDVLDFSKIEAGKMEIDASAFDIRTEVDNVLSLFAEKVRNNGVELAALVQLSVPTMVVGDSGRFRQVLINLIGNATKFTEHGHILVTIRQLDEDEDLHELHALPPSLPGMESLVNGEDGITPSSPPHDVRMFRPRRSSLSSLVRITGIGGAFAHGTGSQGSYEGRGGGGVGLWSNPLFREQLSEKKKGRKSGVTKSAAATMGGSQMHSRPGSASEEAHFLSVSGSLTYATLSGRATASGAHTYDKIIQWMHQRGPKGDSKTVRLAIAVEDTGHGIPLAAQGHIFQPFRQADTATSRRSGGTGIGLSISKRLVELQGGTMAFVSKPSIGSTFFFDILLSPAEPSPSPPQRLSQKLGLPQLDRLPGLRVLLVDTRKVRRTVLASYLRNLGVLVDMADSPLQAVFMAQSLLLPLEKSALDDEEEEVIRKGSRQGSLDGGLKRVRSHENLCDTTSPIVRKRQPGRRRRSMEAMVDAAKAMNIARFSPFSSSSVGSSRQGSPYSVYSPNARNGSTYSSPKHRSSLSRQGSIGAKEKVVPVPKNPSSSEGYAAIFIDSDVREWERRGLELADLLSGHSQLAGKPMVLVLQRADADLEEAARRAGFSAVLLKPLRLMSVAVSLIQALGMASSDQVAQLRASPTADISTQLLELLKGKRMLCVDDNLVNRRVAAKMLAKYGVEAICHSSGSAAVEYLSTEAPVDLVFMDLQMPEMDGYEASEKIRELENLGSVGQLGVGKKRVPIVAMTADVLKGTKEKCLAAGMDGYITKPIDSAELLRVVSRFFSYAVDPSTY